MTPRLPPPTFEYLNGEVLEEAPGRVRCRFRPTEEMANPWGAVQGGILAAFFDDTMGPAVVSVAGGRGFTTMTIHVTYLRPAKPGEPLVCEATVVRHGRMQAYAEATLTRESDGELLARASSVNLFLERPKKG